MKIEIKKTDRFGKPLEIGDTVELFDWGSTAVCQQSLGTATLTWDSHEGRVSSDPVIVEDAYDFWTKALPRCVKANVKEEKCRIPPASAVG